MVAIAFGFGQTALGEFQLRPGVDMEGWGEGGNGRFPIGEDEVSPWKHNRGWGETRGCSSPPFGTNLNVSGGLANDIPIPGI